MTDLATTAPSTITLLTRLAKTVYKSSSESLLGMKLRHFVVVSYLAERDGVPQQYLQDVLGIDANNLVILLNELESLGLAERRRDASDRRRHIVVITEAGRAASANAEKAREAVEDVVLAGLDTEERETLRQLLAKALEV